MSFYEPTLQLALSRLPLCTMGPCVPFFSVELVVGNVSSVSWTTFFMNGHDLNAIGSKEVTGGKQSQQ